MDIEKRSHRLAERLVYLRDICAGKHDDVVDLLDSRLKEFHRRVAGGQALDANSELITLEELFAFMERKLVAELTPMDRVRIVRHPQRICLRDILENVYDNFTELGGMNENSIDPGMLIARAYVTRTRGKRSYNQFIMVIGHEKGHGEEFRNGGSVKPWGNAKALHYMKVAETEGIPIHTYVFTPGSYPVEDAPGA
ncbi:MAG: acetyl-CoA carboxylase carboxyl transferase subunit alpha/beta, partial [Deltaproteobacteria bacterium]|nr:acetyl-CoA carboxylase carboxyl transferase subunit alpha/beta [Deltaproteobacteria bacterium]